MQIKNFRELQKFYNLYYITNHYASFTTKLTQHFLIQNF